MRSTSICFGGLLAATISGCAIVSSDPLGGPAVSNQGIPYLLPKALLPIEVVVTGTQVRVDMLEPVFVGDPDHPFVLRYNPSAFSTDDIKLEVDPKTSLLKSVTLTSADETGEVLKKAISTVVRAESATGAGETVLLQALLDPDDPQGSASVARQIDAAVSAHITRQRPACDATPATPGCADLVAAGNAAKASVSVRLAAGDKARAAVASAPGVDCTVGICHRGMLPYRVDLGLFGQSRSTLVLLPNQAPVLSLPLGRHAFVKVKHTVVLSNGVVQKYDVDKPSSALAIVSWPLDVYGAIVDTTAKIIQFKIDTSRNDVALKEQLVSDAEKRKALDERIEKLSRPESAGLVTMGVSNKLLTVGIGLPPRSSLPPGADDKPARSADTAVKAGAAGEAPKVMPSSDGKTGGSK